MTLPECDENSNEQQTVQQPTVVVVEDISDDKISDLKKQKVTSCNRLVTGPCNCANVLYSKPEDVVLCLLLDTGTTEQLTLHIEHTLIEAYCYENNIPVVKGQAALHLLEKEYQTDLDNIDEQDLDLSCILVLFVKDSSMDKDEELLKPYFQNDADHFQNEADQNEELLKSHFQDDVFHDISDVPSIKFPI